MRLKLSHILAVMLFLAAGPLCRLGMEHAVRQEAVGTEHALWQAPLPQGVDIIHAPTQSAAANRSDAARYLRLALFAPEITGDFLFQSTDHKALSRTLSFAGYCVHTRPVVAGSIPCDAADLHPEGVDYYVYTLGKIRI